jgi:hypothetical protein
MTTRNAPRGGQPLSVRLQNLGQRLDEGLDYYLGPTGISDRLRAINQVVNPYVNYANYREYAQRANDPALAGSDRARAAGLGSLEAASMVMPFLKSLRLIGAGANVAAAQSEPGEYPEGRPLPPASPARGGPQTNTLPAGTGQWASPANSGFGQFLTQQPGDTPGMIASGNINLAERPRLQNPDGSFSTVESISIGTDDGEVLIPTISPDGRRLSEDEAIQLYEATGQHLGIFRSPSAADAFARWLSMRAGS